jgi:catechol 2,3-dioxygenase-like lactoylglutathione lyase family enzyme
MNSLLSQGSVANRLPAEDLDRARRFYSEKLGLEPAEERPGGLLYKVADGSAFAVFQSAGKPSGTHTQMGWSVDDIEAVVADLRARGLEFEQYDMPGVEVVDGIALVPGNYPSKGTAERAVWFYDSEGNLIGIGEPVR